MSDQAASEKSWGVRSVAALVLFVLATVLTIPALVGHWGYRTVIDSQRYIQTVGPLIEQPAVLDREDLVDRVGELQTAVLHVQSAQRDEVQAGDICAVVGVDDADIGDMFTCRVDPVQPRQVDDLHRRAHP